VHLVFIGAHPDDETSAGGTIAKYVDRGHKATIVVATRGGRGHWKIPSEELERIRTGEMEAAAEVLGADVVFLDYRDADVPAGDALREELVDVVRRLKPDVVITFHPMVWRDDHESQWVKWEIDDDASTKPLEEVIEGVRHRSRQLGRESGVKYAEAFISQYGRRKVLDLFP
jgi:L-ascorbate metabolism protein UlaG (beta-lactamase superfamily)